MRSSASQGALPGSSASSRSVSSCSAWLSERTSTRRAVSASRSTGGRSIAAIVPGRPYRHRFGRHRHQVATGPRARPLPSQGGAVVT